MPVNNSLVVSNWNVERPVPGQQKFDRITEVLHDIESDIWFLTETHQALVPKIGFYSLLSGTPDRDGAEGERWSAIWSRWPIKSLNSYVTDKARCVAGVIENSPLGELVLYGTVLPWSTDPRASLGGSYETYQENLSLQMEDWRRIRKDFPHSQNLFILGGDFNQSLAPAHYYGSKEKRVLLESVMREFSLEVTTAMGNDPVFRDSAPNACIDHICVSSGSWQVISTTRWPDAPNLKSADSDHFGVKVEIG